MKFLTIFFTFFLPFTIEAQKIDIPESFEELLAQVGIDFNNPRDAAYKDIRVLKNEYQEYQFAIFSRKEDLEIRYAIKPFDAKDVFSANPHVLTMRSITSVATNEEEKAISAIPLEKEIVLDDFNADWGMIYFFQPKEHFAFYKHCKMLALHKEGRGTVFVYFLFDKADNEALEYRHYSLRFQDRAPN